MSRLIDEQRQKFAELNNLYANLKKEPLDRRKEERKLKYEQERITLWADIEKNHKTLMEADPPKEYEEKFKEATTLNAKFYERLKTWVHIKEGKPGQVAVAAGGTSTLETFQDCVTTPFSTPSTLTWSSSIASSITTASTTTYVNPQASAVFQQVVTSAPTMSSTNYLQSLTTSQQTLGQQLSSSTSYQPAMSCNALSSNANVVPTPISWNQPAGFSNANSGHQDMGNQPSVTPPYPMSWNQQQNMQELECATNIEKILLMFAQNQRSQNSMKARKIDVTPFDGSVQQYRSFKEMFTRSILHGEWGPIDLFVYLRSLLRGEALDAISSLEASTHNYNVAWNILERRYNNPRKLLETTMKLLTDSKFKAQSGDSKSFTAFVNTYQTVLANVRYLKASTEDVIMEFVLPRLDPEVRGRFEDFIGMSTNTPLFEQMDHFFEKEKIVWDNRAPPKAQKQKVQATSTYVTTKSDEKSEVSCFICKNKHPVLECSQFIDSNDKVKLLKKHYVCIYCAGHKYDRQSPCRSRKKITCEIETCKGHHLTILHPPEARPTADQNDAQQVQAYVTQQEGNRFSILPTAIASILDAQGRQHEVRCLIDLCAETSYICEGLVQKLRLKKIKSAFNISGLSGISTTSTSSVKFAIRLTDPTLDDVETEAVVVPKITSGTLPRVMVEDELAEFKDVLADPYFNKPSFIGVLLGCDVGAKLFINGVPNQVRPSGIVLQPTHLGWIVSGCAGRASQYVSTYVTMNESVSQLTKDNELSKRIIDFYELPEIEDTNSDLDDLCEKLYQEKHFRLEDGRYVVPIPWKPNAPKLGHSYRRVLSMFKSQEAKWQKNKVLYDMSNKFMQEYEQMGHMTRIGYQREKNQSSEVYYIPYICILRCLSLTTKLRNVFNASMPTSNGVSLNDTMFEGPKLQTSIKDIMLTARSFKIIYAADVSMMFRQIFVRPEDRDKLRILWRPTPNEPVREYTLNTVTYGTDAAPYLAIRTIHQCARDNAPDEETENIIRKGFYVDDLLFGADTVEKCKQQILSINSTMDAGKFPLTKWMSSNIEVLNAVSPDKRVTKYLAEGNTNFKLLGMPYNFNFDDFHFNYKQPSDIKFTKRGISSAAASFYDPLGFILPFIMILRLFLQKVWKHKIEWDQHIGENLSQQFRKLVEGVHLINNIRIPRHIPSDEDNITEFIGFSDASNVAQAAVVYSRIRTSDGYKVTFVTAKGNVSKTKTTEVVESKQCTIPKLELQALDTLATLFTNLKTCFSHRNIIFTAYTDSQVVLAWIRNNKHSNIKYVQKRIDTIRKVINPENLHYVKSEENPADPASRGLSAAQLASNHLWFNGPEWLTHDELPTTPYTVTCELTTVLSTQKSEEDMFIKYSSWSKIVRIAAYCMKWSQKTRSIGLTTSDIITAKQRVLKYYQQIHLGKEHDALLKGNPVSKRHWLYNLTPFIDENGLIRVGGRLNNAENLTNWQKHPIVVPKCRAQKLLIDYTHKKNNHAGHSLTLRILLEEYWIVGVKMGIKDCIKKCVRCIRWNAQSRQPQMGQLPKERITPSVTFEKVGVDLCGPFHIKASPLRFDRSMKVWVVNFVCLVTKAVHLDVVSSLSTESFLAAFSRFCSRRGTSSEVWSDNGTNFVGANRVFMETWKQLVKQCEQQTAAQEVTWRFIPRHSPTFGGLWEACVKSLKYFVRRMANVKNLTFEDFTTLLCKVEALLNSRPLFPNPLTPHDPPALTPFHFINQRGFKPTSVDGAKKVPLTKKWLMIQEIQQQFWERFQTEYLRMYQSMVKWQLPQKNLNVKDIVLIKEPSASAGDWKMGEVIKVYPDSKGAVRKVDVITPSKEKTLHSVNQLVPLLEAPEEQAQIQSNIRRTTRSTRLTSVHFILTALLVFFPGSNSLPVEELSTGVHVRHIGSIYHTAFDMKFTVTTNLNLSADIELIHSTSRDFENECIALSVGKPTISHLCSNLNASIHDLSFQITSEMYSSYNKKDKRWIQVTAKGLFKAAPAILTGAGMVYQEMEISSLKDQLQHTRTKIRKTAHALLKVTDLEYEAMDSKLTEMIQKQNDLQTQEVISSYANNIFNLFRSIKTNHDDVIVIKPLKELQQHVKTVLSKSPNLGLPNFGDSIFDIYPVDKDRSNDLTTVTFTVPIVNIPQLLHVLIVSVPNDEGQQLQLHNNKTMMKIAVHPITNKFVDISDQRFIYQSLMENLHLEPMDSCTKAIYTNMTGDETCRKVNNSSSSPTDETLSIDDDLAVVFTHIQAPVIMNCSDSEYIILKAAIVNISECTYQQMIVDVITAVPHVELEHYTDVQAVTLNPQLAALKENIRSLWEDTITSNSGYASVTILFLITMAIYLVIVIKCYKSSRQDRWFQNWEGPPTQQ